MGQIEEDRRELIACVLGRLDVVAMLLIKSGATLEEQHAILGDLTAASLAVRFLGSTNLDAPAAVAEAWRRGSVCGCQRLQRRRYS